MPEYNIMISFDYVGRFTVNAESKQAAEEIAYRQFLLDDHIPSDSNKIDVYTTETARSWIERRQLIIKNEKSKPSIATHARTS